MDRQAGLERCPEPRWVAVSVTCVSPCRYRAMRSWGVIGGLAAAVAAGIYVLWGPIAERKKRRRGRERRGGGTEAVPEGRGPVRGSPGTQ